MDRNRTRNRKTMPRYMLQLAAAATLALAACSERPSGPDDPPSPPRPETAAGYVVKANFVLPGRPVPPSPGWM
jgi:hypothetical protein